MKRKKGERITAICLAVVAVICVYNGVSYFQKKQRADNPYKAYATKEESRKEGNFEYIYRTGAEGVWISVFQRWKNRIRTFGGKMKFRIIGGGKYEIKVNGNNGGAIACCVIDCMRK